MTKKQQGRPDGRGCSEGSRRHQFGPGNQAARNRSQPKNKPLPDNSVEALRAALYQDVRTTKNGKSRKMPYITAFFQKTLADAMSAPLADKLKFYKKIEDLGIMDVQKYKERIERFYQNYCDELYHQMHIMRSTLADAQEYIETVGLERILFRTALDISYLECTCGAAKSALTKAHEIMLAGMEDLASDDDETDEFSGDESTPQPRDSNASDGAPLT